MNNLSIFGKSIIRKRRQSMSTLYKTCLVIAGIGCINWGLLGIFDFNLVEFLFGNATIITRIVYIIVAVAGIIDLGILTKDIDK